MFNLMKVTGKLIGQTPSLPTLLPRTKVPVEGAGKRLMKGGERQRKKTKGGTTPLPREVAIRGYPQGADRPRVPFCRRLIDCVHDARRVVCLLIDRNSTLWAENRELKSGASPKAMAIVERRATELSAELERVKATLRESEQRYKDHELAANSAHSELKDLREL
ncbi:hypothetical protein BHE74_00021962 [Ensete ventricosum]|nr:hypothetical protein BHE74_00021962 [Ensete ventricosum]